MIFHDSKYEDIYRIMSRETEKVNYHGRKQNKRILRSFAGKDTWPAIETAIYTVPESRNRYLLWYYCAAPHTQPLSGSCLFVETPDKGVMTFKLDSYSVTDKGKRYQSEKLQVYNSHFFARYRERIMKGNTETPARLIARYYGRNASFMAQVPPRDIMLEPEKHNNASGWQVCDGLILGTKDKFRIPSGREIEVFRYNTILPHSMLKTNQSQGIIHPDMFTEIERNAKEIFK